MDPLMVEAIVQFPPMHIMCQLKSIQGKVNFIHHFIINYAEITKGFIHFVNKGVPFNGILMCKDILMHLKRI
jgi:hypothetical protein